MPLELVRQDITKMKVDAIVNAANTQLAMGGGVCGAIFRAAGVSRMAAACDRFAPIHTGEAVITPGFNLPSRYVIHTAGPIWRDGNHDEERLPVSYTHLFFAILAWCMIVIALQVTDRYVAMVLMCVTIWIVGQAMVNIGVVVGVFPVLGAVSYTHLSY